MRECALRWGGTMVVASTLILGLLHLSANWDSDPDSVSYLSIARNIAQGKLERLGTPHTLYEPTYPALLAPAFLLPGPTFLWVSVIQALASGALVGGVWYWCSAYSRERAINVSLLTATSVGVWMMHRVARPEIAYMAATAWAGGFLARGFRDAAGPRFWRWTVAGGAAAAAATALRPLPFVCIGAAAALARLAMARRVPWGRAAAAAMVVGLMSGAVELGWIKLDRAMADASQTVELDEHSNWAYIDFVKDWFDGDGRGLALQVAEGARRETGEVGRLMIPGMRGVYAREGAWGNPLNLVYLGFFAAVCAAWWRSAWRGPADALVWMAPPYLLLFVLSKYDQGTRYLVPLVPVLWFCAFDGLRRWEGWRAIALAVLVDAHLLVSVGDRVMKARGVAEENRHWPALREMAAEMGTGRAVSQGLAVGDSRVLMLSYLTDRAIARPETSGPLPEDVVLVVSDPKLPAPAGFGLAGSKAGISLYRRCPK